MNSYKVSVNEWVEAFEFGMWISAQFKIYLIKEFQRRKEEEGKNLA